MSEDLSPIERYRAEWKPNEARVAILRGLMAKAEAEGDLAGLRDAYNQLWDEMQPPRHLPIKNLDRVKWPKEL